MASFVKICFVVSRVMRGRYECSVYDDKFMFRCDVMGFSIIWACM